MHNNPNMTSYSQNMSSNQMTNVLSDQVIASDLLNAVKTSIKEYASALTETSTPEVHRTLEQQFSQSVRFHENITQFMMQKGWYKPYDVQQMVQSDIQQVQQIQQNVGHQNFDQQGNYHHYNQQQQQRQQQQQHSHQPHSYR